MGYLLIRDMDVTNIDIKNNYYGYRLSYNTPYIKTSIVCNLHGITIKELPYEYIINVNDVSTIKLVDNIDALLSRNITNYKEILNRSGSTHYLSFKKNHVINNIIKKYSKSSSLPIKIIKVKKCASYSLPIVYIQ